MDRHTLVDRSAQRLIAGKYLFLLIVLFGCAGLFGQDATSRIVEKPTSLANGVVKLKVTLLASGKVGDISVVSGLGNGLTERAIAAAKQIKFEPKRVDGKPVTTVVTLDYTFDVIPDENDSTVAKVALITKRPEAKHPSAKSLASIGGKVILEILLDAVGKIEVRSVESTLPAEFEKSAREAAKRITFEPAKREDGKNISVTRKIEYEFFPQS